MSVEHAEHIISSKPCSFGKREGELVHEGDLCQDCDGCFLYFMSFTSWMCSAEPSTPFPW